MLNIKVTRAILTGDEIKSLIDGESNPINMTDGESPYDFLSRIYNELAANSININSVNEELLDALQDLVARRRIYINTSNAESTIAKALREKK